MRELGQLAHRGYLEEGDERFERRVLELSMVGIFNRVIKNVFIFGSHNQLCEEEEGGRLEASLSRALRKMSVNHNGQVGQRPGWRQ